MIIGDFNFRCVTVAPYEAYPELIVNPDTVLSFAAALKWLQAIAGKKSQIRDHFGSMNLDEFPLNNLSKPTEAFGISALKNELRISGSERSDHGPYYMTLYVSRQGRYRPSKPDALR